MSPECVLRGPASHRAWLTSRQAASRGRGIRRYDRRTDRQPDWVNGSRTGVSARRGCCGSSICHRLADGLGLARAAPVSMAFATLTALRRWPAPRSPSASSPAPGEQQPGTDHWAGVPHVVLRPLPPLPCTWPGRTSPASRQPPPQAYSQRRGHPPAARRPVPPCPGRSRRGCAAPAVTRSPAEDQHLRPRLALGLGR